MKIMRFLIGGIALPLMAFVLVATTQEKSQKSEKASGAKTVTGCLQKGDKSNEYSIMELRRAGFVPQTPEAFAKFVGRTYPVSPCLPQGLNVGKAQGRKKTR